MVLGPVLQPQYSLSRKLSDNTECRRHQIRKTNLTLQQLSINSNMRYFAPNALPRSFESGRYALPTARFARQTLAVEWKISHHALNFNCSVGCHITVCCEAYCRGVLGRAQKSLHWTPSPRQWGARERKTPIHRSSSSISAHFSRCSREDEDELRYLRLPLPITGSTISPR